MNIVSKIKLVFILILLIVKSLLLQILLKPLSVELVSWIDAQSQSLNPLVNGLQFGCKHANKNIKSKAKFLILNCWF